MRRELNVLRPLSTPEDVLPWLETDRLWCAYAIGDLADPFWSAARFFAKDGAVVLHLSVASWDAIFVHGDAGAIATVLAEIPELPRRANLHVRPQALEAMSRFWTIGTVEPTLRQFVTRARFTPIAAARETIERLHDAAELTAFYAGRADGWDPAQVQGGTYFGVRGDDGLLLAVAGTHAVSERHRIAVLGNVLTEPAARGRGLTRVLSSAVVARLLETCDEVVLNVRAENAPALAVYRDLGFRTHCEFIEAVGSGD